MFQECLAVLENKEKAEKQKKQEDVQNQTGMLYDVVSDQEMVDRMFDFLPSVIGGQEGPAPLGFEVSSNEEMMGTIFHPQEFT